MKTRDKGHLIRTICALALAVGLVFLSVSDASAHKIRPRYVHDHHLYYESGTLPRWLKKDRGFRRWYAYNHHRLPRRMSWHRLYDCYLDEQRRYRRIYRYGDVRHYHYRPWPYRRW